MKINSLPQNNTNSKMSSANIVNKSVSFSGGFKPKEFFQLAQTGQMTRNLFILNAFVFLLGGRLITSRDGNERRETLTRDIPSIVLAVQGVPFFESICAKQLQKRSGFALGSTSVNKKTNVESKYKLDVASSDTIKDWYKYDENLATGFEGFSQRLASHGGNLKKIYSKLGDNVKSKISSFSNDNAKFMESVSKDSGLKTLLIKELTGDKNKAFEQARFLKAVPKIFGFFVTITSIGIFLPKLNIFLTERINKNKKREEMEVQKK